MKLLYKIMLVFIMFELTIVLVNLFNVFPYTLYSDEDIGAISSLSDPLEVFGYFFSIPALTIGSVTLTSAQTTFTFGLFMAIFGIAGAGIARISGNWTPIIAVVIATMFVPMLMKSRTLFGKLFVEWDNAALAYMVIILFVGIAYIAMITIVETPTHGQSGGND